MIWFITIASDSKLDDKLVLVPQYVLSSVYFLKFYCKIIVALPDTTLAYLYFNCYVGVE